ncbi:MAG: SpoIID/LytB domain-containing protein [Candidatus Eremiobacteraeota bacterium]|nr:SpoIID/LytB domain-containing protein [Candidatus Eremiobacteraeota bacterium]
MRRLLVILLLLSHWALADEADNPDIRVALLAGVSQATVAAEGGLTLKSTSAKVLAKVPERAQLAANSGQVAMAGKALGHEVLLVPSRGVVLVADKPYRGYVRVVADGAGLTVINVLPLETYINSVLGGEVNATWPAETLKACAVASRTYAYFMMSRSRDRAFDVVASVMDQVYPGVTGEAPSISAAVSATRGRVLATASGQVLKSYFSSCCGGHTADSITVFGEKVPHLKGVEDPFCLGAPNSSWTETFSVEDIRKALARVGKKLDRITSLKVEAYDDSGRIKTLVAQDARGGKGVLKGSELRKLLGFKRLKGTRCKVEAVGDPPQTVRFQGGGFGHGVGMCQWGAHEMGVEGFSYKEILGHYYVGAYLKKLGS